MVGERVGEGPGEMEECIEGVRVVDVLSWRLEDGRVLADLPLGICTADVRSCQGWTHERTYDPCACRNPAAEEVLRG